VEYIDYIKKEVNADFAGELERIKEVLKLKVMQAKNTDVDSLYKSPNFYPASGPNASAGKSSGTNSNKKNGKNGESSTFGMT
jgi:hypothetical protein